MCKMKSSGIEWIGEVPDQWNIERLQWSIKEVSIKNFPIKTTQVLSLTNKKGVIPYEEKGNQGNKSKENYSEYKIAYKDTLVVNSMNVIIGSTGISNYFGCVSPVYYVFMGTGRSDIKFINYIFSTVGFQKELRKYANGILEIRLRISSDNIVKRSVALPDLVMQRSIIKYIDKKCYEIDTLVTKMREQIDALIEYKSSVIREAVTKGFNLNEKMKDTGIKWLGSVPESWKMSKIKYEIFPLNRPVLVNDNIITCFRDGEVTLRNRRREEGFTISFTEHGYQGVDVGDLVIHGMDAFAGAIGCSDSRGKCTPVVHVCKTTGNNRFYMYFLRSMAINNVFMDYSEGIRVRSSDFRNFYKLGKFTLVVPPLEEQNKIVYYLDNKCMKIDAIVVDKKNQISLGCVK